MAWLDYFKTVAEQLAMLVSGTEEDGTAIPGPPVGESEHHIGEVGGSAVVKEVTLSLDTNAYADGDVLAATQEVSGSVRVNGGTGVIQSLVVLDKDAQGQALDVVFLKANKSLGTENAAVSIADADADSILGIVEVLASDLVNLNNSLLATRTNLSVVVEAGSGSTSLYVAAISRGTGTYTASGITLKIGILQD
jgi:hypothetical protein